MAYPFLFFNLYMFNEFRFG